MENKHVPNDYACRWEYPFSGVVSESYVNCSIFHCPTFVVTFGSCIEYDHDSIRAVILQHSVSSHAPVRPLRPTRKDSPYSHEDSLSENDLTTELGSFSKTTKDD